ncbi:hypothetical protein GQX73_g7635 [Xylaria multiplex]|uniref:Uncharacterized protein n=1 Tax=Xylaria multiplex TaxID=323545 RepID=A0A7C8N1F2_9PEZI|nr:hypothetical protein GQX73_g7635 [Xylaria multiplex]
MNRICPESFSFTAARTDINRDKADSLEQTSPAVNANAISQRRMLNLRVYLPTCSNTDGVCVYPSTHPLTSPPENQLANTQSCTRHHKANNSPPHERMTPYRYNLPITSSAPEPTATTRTRDPNLTDNLATGSKSPDPSLPTATAAHADRQTDDIRSTPPTTTYHKEAICNKREE